MNRRQLVLGLLSSGAALLWAGAADGASGVLYTLTVEHPAGASREALVSMFQKAVVEFKDSHRGVTVLGLAELFLLDGEGRWLARGEYPVVDIFERGDFACALRLADSVSVQVETVRSLTMKFYAVKS